MEHPHRPKRIALFTGNYNHVADGVSLTLNRLVRYLEALGSQVMVVAPTIENPPIQAAGRFHPVPSLPMPIPNRHEYRVALPISMRTRREVAQFRPQLIHIATPDLPGRNALKLGRKLGIPVVASYHTHFSSYLTYYNMDMLVDRLWRYLKKFYDQCDQVYVPSESMADVLREHGIHKNLLLWERGVETDRFSPTKRSEAWRLAHGASTDEPIVLFVSRLVWEKGLDVFARVIQGLEQSGIPHKSVIVGNGSAEDELREQLPNTYFTGHLGGEDLATAYASSDIFLFPSTTETFGNVTLEAMASGLPTVCADATGSKGLVIPHETGFLLEAGHSSQFFDHVKALITNTAQRLEMGNNARKRAQLYSWDEILGKIDGYYDRLLFPPTPQRSV
ncbi:MAG: glycosyltransferase family 1 protein [Rhodothermia bacterium]|nr:glycosyltransferase family 1 protein [Rhodothermia bacterium]